MHWEEALLYIPVYCEEELSKYIIVTIDHSAVKRLFHPYAYNRDYVLMLYRSNSCVWAALLKSINIQTIK